MLLEFEWDEAKARANERKHRVTFDEAATVFHNDLAQIFPDADHSNGEIREIIVGHSALQRSACGEFHGTVDKPDQDH